LHFGSRAVAGAIDHYRGDGEFTVLGDAKPVGFCGSAYIDFLAVERKAGHLNEFGRYEPRTESMYVTDELFIHEYDIEQLLKAKAAVWAGIKTLEDHCQISRPLQRDCRRHVAGARLPNRRKHEPGRRGASGGSAGFVPRPGAAHRSAA